jgi:hypothetical protein
MKFGKRIGNWLLEFISKFLRERIFIDLDNVDHNKTRIWEAIGINPTIFKAYEKYIISEYTPQSLAEALGLYKPEIAEAFEKSLESSNVKTKIITNWWKKRGRKKITLEEWVGTYLLINFFGFIGKGGRPGLIIVLKKPFQREKFHYIV